MRMTVVNPATGETIKTFEELSDAELSARLSKAQRAFESHRKTSFGHRAQKMLQVSELLEKRKDSLARLMVNEMGKPLTAALAEVDKCAWVCRYYAEFAESFLAGENLSIEGQKSFVRYLPLGAILAVMPWNFPFWQVFRFAAPALMAGNVGLLKHASNVPGCALAIEALFVEAGFDAGEFQTLLINASRVGEVIAHDSVAAVTLTGSEHAGATVAAASGKALKKTVLELGGSDPFIVMPSANVEKAARAAVTSRLLNNGQSCISAKRFIVHEAVYDAFERHFVELMKATVIGNPMEASTQLGPLATSSALKEVASAVDEAGSHGARLLCGGNTLPGPGYFYAPTVLSHIPRGCIVDEGEVFGPVAALYAVKNMEEAISLANRHRYGLASSVWTNDEMEQEAFIRELEAGATFVNAMVASDPRLPFGGIKKSGYGRELAKEGIREFMNLKTVVIRA